MALRDISVTLRPGTPEWPGDTPFDCRWTWQMARGDSVNVSTIAGSPHVGTHADAPLHVHDGWDAADRLPIDAFIGPCVVCDVRSVSDDGGVELDALGLPGEGPVDRLLLRTGRSIAGGSFPATWPVLSDACVDALLARGLRLLGVDCPSVDERESKLLRLHLRLFTGGACILENLDLRDVPGGIYELVAAPMKLAGLDAAPVRAVLRDPPDR